MARFGGKKYGLDQQAKGPDYWGLSDDELRGAWEMYECGTPTQKLVKALERYRSGRKDRLNLKQLIVEWGALGLPIWTIGRRSKIRHETTRTLQRVKKKNDLTTTPAMYAALTYVEEHDVDLKAIVERDFGAAPKRAKMWWQKARAYRENGWTPWK